MSKQQAKEKQHNHDDYDDDFYETELSANYDVIFKDTTTKQYKAKSKKKARQRIEDYFERKALKEKIDSWDNYFN